MAVVLQEYLVAGAETSSVTLEIFLAGIPQGAPIIPGQQLVGRALVRTSKPVKARGETRCCSDLYVSLLAGMYSSVAHEYHLNAGISVKLVSTSHTNWTEGSGKNRRTHSETRDIFPTQQVRLCFDGVATWL
jgi:hypothetical protein